MSRFMVRFPDTFKAPGAVVFLPSVRVASPDGGYSYANADPSAGVAVAANVQPGEMVRVVTDGIERFQTRYIVCLMDNPSALNGGLGVRANDAFSWSGMAGGDLLISQGTAVRVGSVWRVECLVTR